jgi:hypothetical protein
VFRQADQAGVAQAALALPGPGLPERELDRPTEAMKSMLKRVKRAAFGFTNFTNYRIRSLLHAGKPDWSMIGVVTPRWPKHQSAFSKKKSTEHAALTHFQPRVFQLKARKRPNIGRRLFMSTTRRP